MADGSASSGPNLRVAGGSSQVFALSDGDRNSPFTMSRVARMPGFTPSLPMAQRRRCHRAMPTPRPAPCPT